MSWLIVISFGKNDLKCYVTGHLSLEKESDDDVIDCKMITLLKGRFIQRKRHESQANTDTSVIKESIVIIIR